MPQNTYIQSILNYFSSMDIEKLRFFLNDEHTYEDTTKEIFLNQIEGIFNAHRNSDDTELIIYQGKCAGKSCQNCGKKGYRFVGNKSNNYLDLIFETEGDDIKDIYSCSIFKSDIDIEGLGSEAYIDIKEDDKVTFNKTPEYWAKVYAASNAYSEIVTEPPKEINFEFLCYWLDKHKTTDDLIGSFDSSDSTMKWSIFSHMYSNLLTIRKYISDNLEAIENANQKISQINNESELINWIIENEKIFHVAPFDFREFIIKQNNGYLWDMEYSIIFVGETFNHVLNSLTYFDANNQELLEKYSTYTFDELVEFVNNNDPKNEKIDAFSLKFHLDYRKTMEGMGITLPLYINKV